MTSQLSIDHDAPWTTNGPQATVCDPKLRIGNTTNNYKLNDYGWKILTLLTASILRSSWVFHNTLKRSLMEQNHSVCGVGGGNPAFKIQEAGITLLLDKKIPQALDALKWRLTETTKHVTGV